MSRSTRKGMLAVVLAAIVALAATGPAWAVLVTYTPAAMAGYTSAGFTVVVSAPISGDFYAEDPNSGQHIDGTLTSGVLQNPTTLQYLFYYTIAVDLGSDPIDAMQLTNFNPPMHTELIGSMGYNTDVTGSDLALIPTAAMAWVPPGVPWAKYQFDNDDGIPAGYVSEVYYIAGGDIDIVTGTAILINTVSATAGAQVLVQGPGTEIVPEPATLLLMGAGLLGVALLRRRH